jgi:haloalkane dehalogenase
MQINFQPSKELYPFTSRWFESSVGRMHYIDEGQGRPILLVHGNPTWSFLYRKLIPQLSGFRSIAMDHPGFGLSAHPDNYGYTASEHAKVLQSLVRHLNLNDMIVFGQDWGGPIGVWVASEEAERVAGLVLGSTLLGPARGLIRFIMKLMNTWLGRRFIASDQFIRRIMRGMAKVPLSDEELAHYTAVAPSREFRRGIIELPKQLFTAEEWLARSEQEAKERLAQTPVLLLRTPDDRRWGKRYLAQIQSTFPNNTVVDVDHAGHFLQEDAPEAVAAAIKQQFGAQLRGNQGMRREVVR